MCRVDGERREHREDAVLELARELRRGASSSRSCQSTNSTPASCERGRDVLREHGRLARDELLDTRADRAELLDLVEPVGRGRADAGRELVLQTRDAHLEELVEIAS